MIPLNEDTARWECKSWWGFWRFTPVMEIFVSALLLFLHPAFPKLIIHPNQEAQLSTELLLKEADLVRSYQQPGLYNDVQEEVKPPVLIWKKKLQLRVRCEFYDISSNLESRFSRRGMWQLCWTQTPSSNITSHGALKAGFLKDRRLCKCKSIELLVYTVFVLVYNIWSIYL